jgi:hypothetical protein
MRVLVIYEDDDNFDVYAVALVPKGWTDNRAWKAWLDMAKREAAQDNDDSVDFSWLAYEAFDIVEIK